MYDENPLYGRVIFLLNSCLVLDFRVPQNLLTRLRTLLEVTHIQVLIMGTSNDSIEINPVTQIINLNMNLRRTRH